MCLASFTPPSLPKGRLRQLWGKKCVTGNGIFSAFKDYYASQGMCGWYNTTYSLSDDRHIIYIFRSDSALGMIKRQRGFTIHFRPNILEHLHLTVAREEFYFTECYESKVKAFNREIIAEKNSWPELANSVFLVGRNFDDFHKVTSILRWECYSRSHFAWRHSQKEVLSCRVQWQTWLH